MRRLPIMMIFGAFLVIAGVALFAARIIEDRNSPLFAFRPVQLHDSFRGAITQSSVLIGHKISTSGMVRSFSPGRFRLAESGERPAQVRLRFDNTSQLPTPDVEYIIAGTYRQDADGGFIDVTYLESLAGSGKPIARTMDLPPEGVGFFIVVTGLLLAGLRCIRTMSPLPERDVEPCPACDFDLRSSPRRCPECGAIR